MGGSLFLIYCFILDCFKGVGSFGALMVTAFSFVDRVLLLFFEGFSCGVRYFYIHLSD